MIGLEQINPHCNNSLYELSESFKKYENTKCNEDLFIFFSNLERFLSEQTDYKVLLFYAPYYLEKAMKLYDIFPKKDEFFKILEIAQEKINLVSLGSNIFALLIKCCESDTLNYNFFSTIFSNSKFIKIFIKERIINKLYKVAFTKSTLNETLKSVIKLIFKDSSNKLFEFVDFRDFFKEVIELIFSLAIPDSNSEFAALFLAKFFYNVSQFQKYVTKFFKLQNGFVAFDFLISVLSPEIKTKCYKYLLFSNDDNNVAPNLLVLKLLFNHFQANDNMKNDIYKLILKVAKKIPKNIYKMDQTVSFEDWTIPNEINVFMITDTIILFSNYYLKEIGILTQILFHKILVLSKEENENEEMFYIYSNVLMVLEKCCFPMNYLIEINFIMVYIIQIPENFFVRLLKDNDIFNQYIIDIYNNDDAMSYRKTIFLSLLNVANHSSEIQNFPVLISSFLVKSENLDSLQQIMKLIDEKYELIDILLIAFRKSKNVSSIFIKNGGIDWASKFEINIFSDILSSLVSQQRFDEIESFIQELPKDYKLFKLDQKIIEKIVFGDNKSEYRPIRVISLLFLLKDIQNINDPYNTYLIGKFCKNIPKDYLLNVLNQYISINSMTTIDLHNDLNLNLLDFAKDHFSFFQIFPGKGELQITEDHKAISFWFRFYKIPNNKISFFQNELVSLRIKNKRLIIYNSRKKVETFIEPLKWNYVLINLESIYIHDIQLSLKSDCFFHLSCFGGFSEQNILFLSPIQVSKFDLNNNYKKDIYYIQDSNCNYYFPSQNSPYINLKNVFSVTYMGLPFYLLSKFNIDDVFNEFKFIESKEEFDKKFLKLFAVNQITDYLLPDFNKILFCLIIKFNKYVTIDLIEKTLNEIYKYGSLQENETFIIKLLFNLENFEKIEIYDFINIIFDYGNKFYQIKWENVPYFQIHISNLIEKKNNLIIRSILKYLNQFPKIIELLISFLNISKCNSSENDEQVIQFTIISELIYFIENFPEKVNIFQNNLSFEELKDLFVISSKKLRVLIYQLITLIELKLKNFFKPDELFINIISSLVSFDVVWNNTILLIQEENNSNFLPIIISLIWASYICLLHSSLLFSEKSELILSIEKNLKIAINLVSNSFAQILNNVICFSFIRTHFPFVINYSYFLNIEQQEGEEKIESNEINIESFIYETKINHVFDYSKNDLDNICIPIKEKQILPSKFISKIISLILYSCNFEIHFQCRNISYESYVQFLHESPIIGFLLNIYLNSSEKQSKSLIHSLFFIFPTNDQHLLQFFFSNFMHKLMNSIKKVYHISHVLRYLNYIIGMSILPLNTSSIISDIFVVSKILMEKDFDKFQFLKNLINAILSELFLLSTNPPMILVILSLFISNINTFIEITRNNFNSWLFLFSRKYLLFPKKIDELMLLYAKTEKSISIYNVNIQEFNDSTQFNLVVQCSKDNLIIEQHKDNNNQIFINSYFKTISSEYCSSTFSFNVRGIITDFIHNNNVLCYKLCSNIEQNLKWEKINLQLKNKLSKPFERKYEFLSSFGFINCIQIIKFPSPFLNSEEIINYLQKNQININELNSFTNNIVFSSIFKPIISFNGKLIRYNISIPSIIIIFHDHISILTYTQLENNIINFINDKPDPLFIEMVLLSQFGDTRLMNSHINININDKSIIECQKLSINLVQFWTYKNGYFIIESENSDYMFKKYNKESIQLIKPNNISQLILKENFINGLSFCDYKSYPIIPDEINKINISKNLRCKFEMYLPTNLNNDSILLNRYNQFQNNFNYTYYKSDVPNNFIAFSKQINVILDPINSLLIINGIKKTHIERKRIFQYGTSIFISSQLILSIDLSFGLTIIYLIDKVKLTIQQISQISLNSEQKSKISNLHMIIGFNLQKEIKLYDYCNGYFLNSIKIDSTDNIIFTFYNDVIFIFVNNELILYDFNGNVITKETKTNISTLTNINDKFIVCGYDNGTLSLIYLSNNKIIENKLKSIHRAKIVSILHCESDNFLTLDSSNMCLKWSPIRK